MAQAVRAEGKKVTSNINVTPMVDVMLVLLIIFMVITPMLQNKVAVDMAKVELLYGKDPVLRRLAQEIIVTQEQEIEVMRMRLKQFKTQ